MKKTSINNTLLVSDMDGTLLNSCCLISNENREALERFVSMGGLFTVATGRMEFAMENYVDQLPVNLPGILYNGAAIYDFKKKKVLWTRCLNGSIDEILADLIDKFPEMGVEIFHGGDIYYIRENSYTDAHLQKERFSPHYLPLSQVPKPWYKVLLAWDHYELEKVEEYARNLLKDARLVFSETQFLEILHKDTSKGTALTELIKLNNLKSYHVIAIGDNMNDFEMIRDAHTGIVVANAHSDLKKISGICCCHHDEHAIAQVVEWIEEGRL